MDALRTADGTLITTEDIALRVIKANGFDAADAALRKAFGEQTLAILRMFRKQGRVDKIGLGRGAVEIGCPNARRDPSGSRVN